MLGWLFFAIAVVMLAGVIALNERELRRMARFLVQRDARSNQRLAKGLPGRGYEELICALNGQLDAAAAERRESEAARRAFQRDLASLSHDIRTPLAGAKGYLQLAEGEGDQAVRSRYAASAAERLDAMEVLLDQLFEYTRASAQQADLEMRPIFAIPVLERALAASFPVFEERGWQPEILIADPEMAVMGDEAALERIFANLIQNALVHGCGPVRIEQRGRTLIFSNPVRSGAPVDESRLFDRFYRGDSARTAPGAGLGLAVVRTLCDAMGLQASARIADGVFSVELRFPPLDTTAA